MDENVFKSPILRAAWHNDHEEVIRLIEEGKEDVNAKDKRDSTSLYAAIFQGNIKMLAALIGAGADVNLREKGGFSPIHLVALLGHSMSGKTKQDLKVLPKVIEMLIEAGADVNARDKDDDQTPLYMAVEETGNIVLVNAFIAARADVNAKDRNWHTPLHRASFNNELVVVQALIDSGADVHVKDKNGFTPLHLAKKVGVTNVLINAGADVNAQCENGYTPLDYASLFSDSHLMHVLVTAGADSKQRKSYMVH